MKRPETLEEALVWLASICGAIEFGGPVIAAYGPMAISGDVPINANIPAAIVAAVGEVWDQVEKERG